MWTGGVSPDPLVASINCAHDNSGRIKANGYLEILGFKDAFAVGDCASINDIRTGNPYPPTAQNALRQARVAANNLISLINTKGMKDAETNTRTDREKVVFDYKTKGVMALIGKRNGVGILFGYKVKGSIAWWFWRSYYLGNLPIVEKRLRVVVDWFTDLIFKRDVTRIKTKRVYPAKTVQSKAERTMAK